jgi:glycosyltransferase involved in cell wall biosynthesis
MNSSPKSVVISYNTARYLYRFRIGIVLGLLDRQYKVIVIAPWDEYSQKLIDLGCEVYGIKMDNKGSSPIVDFMTLLAYRKLYGQLKPDLALHFTIKPNIYGTLAARSQAVPTISMITGLGTAFIQESWLTRVVEQLYKLSLTWPYKVFFQNSDDLGVFTQRGLVPTEKAEQLASSGINLELFTAAPPANNAYPVFLLIGRMLKDKGVIEFVEAARLLKKTYPEVRFQLLGQLDVENRTAISREQVNQWVTEGIVEYLGITDNVMPYIAQADCIVLPSYREGLSRTLLEASAMARPIIATDVTGCREIVDDAVSGYLCKVKDPVDLANKLGQILVLSSDQRAEMGRKGRKKMQKEFDEKIIVERYLEVVDEAIKQQGEIV